MIPMNPKVKLIVGLVVVGGIGALGALGKVEPTWQWIGGIVQVLTAVELFFTPPSAAKDGAK